MKVVSSGIWRPLRWFIILLCLAGGVFAAENNWLTSLRVGHSLTNWLARLVEDEPAQRLVLADSSTKAPDTNYQANAWLNTALFTPPSTGWTLSARPLGGGIMEPGQQSPIASNAPYSANLPAAMFASGFIGFTTGDFGPMPSAPLVSGTWSSTASGAWSNSANWSAGVIANGAGNNANFDALNITTNVDVDLDSSRTIGNLFIGDTNATHSYSISPSNGAVLTFDDNSTDFQVHSILQQQAGSHGDTTNVPILMNNDLEINNLSATHQFTVTGNITFNGSGSAFPILWFNNHDTSANAAGDILVNGVISNGSGGANLNIVVAKGGTVTFTGTNTYTGFTEVSGGTLLVNGDNSAATGTVYVYNNGTLGGTGQVGGNLNVFGGTVTGATTTTVGTLTLLGNANFATGEGDGGTYLANLSGALSDLLAITGTLTLGADTTLNIVGAADGVTTYILATFASRNDVFDTVTGIPSGYALIYNATDIELVPIPEPSTWIGGALALGVVAFAIRKRKLRRA